MFQWSSIGNHYANWFKSRVIVRQPTCAVTISSGSQAKGPQRTTPTERPQTKGGNQCHETYYGQAHASAIHRILDSRWVLPVSSWMLPTWIPKWRAARQTKHDIWTSWSLHRRTPTNLRNLSDRNSGDFRGVPNVDLEKTLRNSNLSIASWTLVRQRA